MDGLDDEQKEMLVLARQHLYEENPKIRAHSQRLKTLALIDRQEDNTFSMLSALNLEVGDKYNNFVIKCCICFSSAVNPFKCTPKAVVSPNGEVPKSRGSPHIACYQCIIGYMVSNKSRVVKCPICRVNQFDLDNIVHSAVYVPQDVEEYCANDCGLRGSTLAMARHICPDQPHNTSGHTKTSIRVQTLEGQKMKLNDDKKKLDKRIRELQDIEYKYNALKHKMKEIRRELFATNNLLITQNYVLKEEKEKLSEDLKQTIRSHEHIKRKAKDLRSKFEEMEQKCDQHIKDLGIHLRPSPEPESDSEQNSETKDVTLEGLDKRLDKTGVKLDLILRDHKFLRNPVQISLVGLVSQ